MPTPAPTDHPRTLVLAPRSTETDRWLGAAAYRRGLRVERSYDWAVPAGVRGGEAYVYAGPLFADAVSRDLHVGLLEPADDWLARLPRALTGRRVEAMPLARARTLRGPRFVKPPADKTFPARVYADGSELPGHAVSDQDALVLVSEVVCFRSEFRLFLLDGRVLAASRYAVDGDLAVAPLDGCAERTDAEAFAAEVAGSGVAGLPSAVVVDIGRTDAGEWAVVEANAAWASGGYACDDDGVLAVVMRAGGPAAEVRASDRAFVRPAPQIVRGMAEESG
ncbi:ATP-grasp domain-containing protein [Yinghuangia sp. YIM S09857]|uniref:ATP-grasp domain-containing protein n=1 Tax=Yinghuangia sp. YIM S09857 TaxID=3436929 RepID=UPI003F5299BC